MKNILFLILIFLFTVAFFLYKIIKFLFYFEDNTNSDNNFIFNKNGKKILIINSALDFGGAEIHTIIQYKKLLKNGYDAKILIPKHSKLEKRLKILKLSYYAYTKIIIQKNTIQPGLYYAIKKICKKDKIQIIHCNIHRETLAAKKVAKKFPVKVILTRHSPQNVKFKYLKNLDGFIGVNPEIAKIGDNKNLNIKRVEFIPPLYEEEKFLNFTPKENKKDFFKNNFNIEIKNIPIISMIANMPKNINHKNHPMLLKAIHKLIHEKKLIVEIMLAGEGPLENYLKGLAKFLKIENYTHFLGFSDKIPELLYHSDIKVLTSKEEGLPIVLFESALLKKSLIGGKGTNLTNVIKHEQTGLLFEQDNVDDLVKQIERLLKDIHLRKKLGENACNFVKKHFLAETSFYKYENFYDKILS